MGTVIDMDEALPGNLEARRLLGKAAGALRSTDVAGRSTNAVP
jgi:hypothetical protein